MPSHSLWAHLLIREPVSTHCECSSGCGWGTGLATGGPRSGPQPGMDRESSLSQVDTPGASLPWLPEIPCCPQWQLCDRTPVLAALSSLHPHRGFLGHPPKKLPAVESSSEFTSGSPTQAVIVPASRGSRWDFLSVWKAQNGACRFHQRQHARCSQPVHQTHPAPHGL